MNIPAAPDAGPATVARLADLAAFCASVLAAAGADAATVDAATRAMMHGSRLGIDSHGVRLLDHYVTALAGGRVNRCPELRFAGGAGALDTLDADNGHGAVATYRAMERAVEIAAAMGIGAVAVRNSSHFGPAGAYAVAAAEAGCIGLVTCNSDSFVRLHDGAVRFHGTNPIAFAVPMPHGPPWLLDMATSAISYNRIQLSRSLGAPLPAGTASVAGGEDTEDPGRAEMLAPLGGAFGYKGAGLAGIAEVLGAVLTGTKLSFDLAPMAGPDFATPRGLGAFVMAIRPDAAVDRERFASAMRRYVETLRASPTRPGRNVLAAGDREWAEAARREKAGVAIDPATATAFRRLTARYGVPLPFGGGRETDG